MNILILNVKTFFFYLKVHVFLLIVKECNADFWTSGTVPIVPNGEVHHVCDRRQLCIKHITRL